MWLLPAARLPGRCFGSDAQDNISGAFFKETVLSQLRAENDILRNMDDRFNPIRTKFSGELRRDVYPNVFGFRCDTRPDGTSVLVRQ